MEKEKIDGYRVCIVGNGVIRNLGISAPYKGALKEEKLRNIMGEGKSINFLKENDASGCLLSPADVMKNGSIEKALEFYGYRRMGATYFVEKYAELGTEGFHKTGDDIITGKIVGDDLENGKTAEGSGEEETGDEQEPKSESEDNENGNNEEGTGENTGEETGEPNAPVGDNGDEITKATIEENTPVNTGSNGAVEINKQNQNNVKKKNNNK